MIWKSGSRKIRLPSSPTSRFFARCRHWGAGKPTDSVERLQIALPYELAVNGLNFNHYYLGGLHSAYVRGEAFLAAHRYAEAAAEFQKILDHRGIVGAGSHRRTGARAIGQSVRVVGRHGQGEGCLPGFPDALERRRLRHPDPRASQGGVRQAVSIESLVPGRSFPCPFQRSGQPDSKTRQFPKPFPRRQVAALLPKGSPGPEQRMDESSKTPKPIVSEISELARDGLILWRLTSGNLDRGASCSRRRPASSWWLKTIPKGLSRRA